ncbi:MAG: hypothetical protein QXZ66_10755, partial [Thermoproteota archaeon]
MKYLTKLIVSIPLCDRCLGRQFSNLIPYPDNETKGRVLKDFLYMNEMLIREEKSRRALKIVRALAESGHGPSSSFIKKNLDLNIVPKPCY